MNFTWEALEQAKKNKEALFNVVTRLDELEKEQDSPGGFDGAEYLSKFRSAMQDDMNSPEALTVALELTKKINTLIDEKKPVNIAVLRLIFEKIFFLFGLQMEKTDVPKEIEMLAKEREKARAEKNFSESDRLRDEISAHGYAIEDIPSGYRLKKQ